MPAKKNRFLLVAMDQGARMTVKPLANHEGFYFPDFPGNADPYVYWQSLFENSSILAVIAGTSDSELGRKIESAALSTASKRGISTIVIEDYPGNYRPDGNANVDVLVVHSEFSHALYKKALAEKCPEIWICKPIRYDSFRQAAKVYREMINGMWKSTTGLQSFVLWAGQPETEDGIETLQRLSPSLLVMDIVLLLKAHPRDEGYKNGVYQQKLKEWGIMYKDVTSLTLNECMAFGPKLVLTQFSSLAIEAGFYGLPSIHVLYEDIGSKRLYTKKGFSTPPWCLEGASFLITNTVHQDEVIRTALKNISERNRQLEIFDQYFGVVAEYTPNLADKIRQLPNTERRRNSHLIQDIQP